MPQLKVHINNPMQNSSMKLIPTTLNFKNMRRLRQRRNVQTVYNSIKNNDMVSFHNNINSKELSRTIEDIELNLEQLISHVNTSGHISRLLLSRTLAKKASRQGSKDENEQLDICNSISQQCGISITNLSSTALRPTKDGEIVTKKEMEDKSIPKDCCLKSFDGEITGNINGYIAAKVAFGSGGHQDNVFEEMDTMADWWKTYKNESPDVLVILIDTDLTSKFDRLKEKYVHSPNIMVYNHVDFQKYLIDTFYKEDNA